jgi:hypothetical protein
MKLSCCIISLQPCCGGDTSYKGAVAAPAAAAAAPGSLTHLAADVSAAHLVASHNLCTLQPA